jgi:hypothetical protein
MPHKSCFPVDRPFKVLARDHEVVAQRRVLSPLVATATTATIRASSTRRTIMLVTPCAFREGFPAGLRVST